MFRTFITNWWNLIICFQNLELLTWTLLKDEKWLSKFQYSTTGIWWKDVICQVKGGVFHWFLWCCNHGLLCDWIFWRNFPLTLTYNTWLCLNLNKKMLFLKWTLLWKFSTVSIKLIILSRNYRRQTSKINTSIRTHIQTNFCTWIFIEYL